MMSTILRWVLCVLVVSTFIVAKAQPSSALRSYMESVRKGGYDPVPRQVLETKDPTQVLQVLVGYERDSVFRVRSRAYNIAKRVGAASESGSVRQIAVDQLVSGIADTDGGISGNCSGGLTGFSVNDFSYKSKTALLSYLTPDQQHLDQVILLIGYLQMEEAKGRLFGLLQTKDSKVRWSIRLALARMGDQGAIDYITSKLSAPRVNDDFVYEIVPDLIYTRSPQVFDFLEKVIMSDEANCGSADPDRNDKILCGYRVLEYIAYAIAEFPISVDEYQEAQISDYEQALVDVRSWFEQHPDYALIRDIY